MRPALGNLSLVRCILCIPRGVFHNLYTGNEILFLAVARDPYVAQNDRRNNRVVVPHPNIAFEWPILRPQKLCSHQQLCLAQGPDCLVRDRVRWYPNLRWNGLVDKSIHRVVAQLGKHVRGFRIVWPYMTVGKGIKSREQRCWELCSREAPSLGGQDPVFNMSTGRPWGTAQRSHLRGGDRK